MNWNYDFFLIGIIWILLIFSIVIWAWKMIKIIIWNYLLIWIALALHMGIDFINVILIENDINFITQQEKLAENLIKNKQRIILIIYLISLIFIFTKSKIWIWIWESKAWRIILWIIFAPLTVISIIIWLSVVVYWLDVFDWINILRIIEESEWSYFQNWFLKLMPVWIIMPALMALIVSTEIKIHKKVKNYEEHSE